LVFLTWMGTPRYAVQLPPAEEVIQTVLPEERTGPVRDLSWEALKPGEWDTRTVAISTAGPKLRQVMAQVTELIVQEHAQATAAGGQGLPNSYAKLAIEEWQPGIRKVTVRLFWQPEGGDWQVQERSVFVNQE
jgi:hypothetical protein